MSGDTVDIGVHSFYTSQTGTGTSASITDVINTLASGISNMTAGAKGTVSQLTNPSGTLYAALNNFITNSDPNPTGKPKAYLNWILFDEQLNPVSSYPQTNAIPVGNYTAGTLGTPGQTGIPMTKNGYLYIWVSNETQSWDVYFDNLSVVHHTGPLLEENHYYPFGLAMAAISAKALKTNYTENKLRYNGGSEMQNKEFSDGSGLEMYETSFRGYDAQIGRFGQIDPMAGSYLDYSAYSYCSNNPILFSDPSGAIIKYQQQYNRLPQLDEYSVFEKLLGGGGGGDGSNDGGSDGASGYGENTASSWAILTGQAPTEFDKMVSAFNAQLDAHFEKEAEQQQKEAEQQQKDQAVSAFIASLPDGETKFTADIALTKLSGYLYNNANGYQFITGAYHGETSYQEGEDYEYAGELRAENLAVALKGLQLGNNNQNAANENAWGPVGILGAIPDGFEGAGEALEWTTGHGANIAKRSGVIGIVLSGVEITAGARRDGWTFGPNARIATDKAAGAIIGGYEGASVGAEVGAFVGFWFFGVGAVPGAVIGGFVGGIVGSIWGGEIGRGIGERR